jgi:polar amino acid transport system substrate-binding protein
VKIYRLLRLFLITLLFSVICFPLALVASETEDRPVIHIAFETIANPPRVMNAGVEIDKQRPGLTLEVLKLVEDSLDIDFVYSRVPWKRALYQLGENDIDGLFHASYKKERQEVGVYPLKNGHIDIGRSIFFQNYSVYTLRNNQVQMENGRINSLEGPVGVKLGYSAAQDLKDDGYEIIEVTSIMQGLRMLQQGRISAFVDLEQMADRYLAKNIAEFSDVKKLYPSYKRKAYYLLFSHGFYKNNKALAEKIWSKIAEIRNSPEYIKVEQEYLYH